jgi:hypothetical protein
MAVAISLSVLFEDAVNDTVKPVYDEPGKFVAGKT